MDGLSAAAGVIAVVSLALQLAGSVRPLSEFWNSISDAPESVRDVGKELELLSNLFSSIANTTLPESQHENMRLILETCASQVETLNSITEQLKDQYSSTSKVKLKWAAIKTVLKAEKIKQARDAIERTKTSLLLAINQNLMIMVAAESREQQQWRNTITHLVVDDHAGGNVIGAVCSRTHPTPMRGQLRIAEGEQSRGSEDWDYEISRRVTPKPRNKFRQNRSQTASSFTNINSIFGRFTVQSNTYSSKLNLHLGEEEGEDRRETGESYITLRTAQWLARFGLRYGIRIAIFNSPGSWKHVLNTFRPVPDDSLIFQFCKTGNIEGVRLLLDRREASTWDTNSDGYTPLHIAASYRHPELCVALLQIGADAETNDNAGRSCLEVVCMGRHFVRTTSSNMINLLRLFIHQADLSEPATSDWVCICELAYQGFEYSQNNCYVPQSSSFAWVLRMLRDIIRGNCSALDMIGILWRLKFDWSKEDMKAALAYFPSHFADWAGWTPLHFGVWFQNYIYTCSLIRQGANIHLAAHSRLWSPWVESPTSIALYSSAAFSGWRQILQNEKLPFEEFITQEIQEGPLGSRLWDKGSLTQLFDFKYEPIVYPDHCCQWCNRAHAQFSLVEIAWQGILQQFNPDEEVMDLLNNLEGRVEWVCVECWYDMLRYRVNDTDYDTSEESEIHVAFDASESDDDAEDQDEDSDSEDSPFLLSI